MRKEVAGGQVEIYTTLSQKRDVGSKITNQPLETKITNRPLRSKIKNRLPGFKIAHGPLGAKITNSAARVQNRTWATRVQNHKSATKVQNHKSATRVQNHKSATRVQNHKSASRVQITVVFYSFFFSMGNAFQYVTNLKVNVVPANFLAQTLHESFPATKLARKQPQGLFMLRKKSPPPDRYHKI